MLTDRPNLPPVAQAMCRLIAEAMMGDSPATMTREVEAIIASWWDEEGVDHFEIEWRLASLNEELVSCVAAGRRPSHPFKNWQPPEVGEELMRKHVRALERLVVAQDAVCRSRTRSLT
jgi:hypothetical protein